MKSKYLVDLFEKRRVRFEVEAESPKEAKVVAEDVYANDESLQDEMLKDESVVGRTVRVVTENGPADGIVDVR